MIRHLLLLFVVGALGLPGSAICDNDNYQLRDEWSPVDRIIVSTNPDTKSLNPLAKQIIGLALKAGVKPVISDQGDASQRAILDDLKRLGIIKNDSDVVITNNPLPNDWARDHAPMVRFDTTKKNTPQITGTAYTSESEANTSIGNISKLLSTPKANVPQLVMPDGKKLGFFADGGDWMTSDSGKTLITTTKLYTNNQEGTPYTLEQITMAVNTLLRKEFGITKVIALEPLKEKAGGYNLANAHVDLQVRTLPGNQVIVARVPASDPQFAVLEANTKKLSDAGYTVIRIDNAPQTAGLTLFKTYTNALFLNTTVVTPKYGDAGADAAAKRSYEAALNSGKPTDKTIAQIDASEAIKFCGAARCAARELYRMTSKPVGKEASSRDNPTISFNASSGALSLTPGIVNFLGNPGDSLPDPTYEGDIFSDAALIVEGLVLDASMSTDQMFSFSGGQLTIQKGSGILLGAQIPVFSIFRDHPEGALGMFGVLSDLNYLAPGTSSWLDTFVDEIIESDDLLADFFISSDFDLIELSSRFTQSFTEVELASMGIVGNGTAVVSLPSSLQLLAWILPFALLWRSLHHDQRQETTQG
jgi:agmatine/peptidylarginine deiminase